jgi:hypothetical protein
MLPFNRELKISEGVYNDNSFSSVRHLANARMTKPEVMNTFITYAYGSDPNYGSKQFPLLFNLDGMGRKRAISSNDGTFTSKMYGKIRKTDTIARTIPNQEKAGIRGGFFKAAFKSKFFMRNEVIRTGGVQRGVSAQVYGDPVKEGSAWIYTLKLVTAKSSDYCPSEYLKQGAIWGFGVVKVGLERSRGTDQRQPHTPYDLQNQLSVIRKSYNFAGNVASKKITIPFKRPDGKVITFWTDWELYQNEMLFKAAKNEDLIWSTYNRNENGEITNIDSDTGEPVPMGMGIWQQIPTEMKYSRMTEGKMKDFISVMLDHHEMGGNQNEGDYVIVGGTGLLEEADAALKRSSSKFLTLSDKYVRGKDNMNLQYGAYFTEYLHSSGKVIKFVYDPSFDYGATAMSSPRHPLHPERSILSYCGLALNFSMVGVDKSQNKTEKESNIVMLYEDGREYEDWMVLGGAKLPSGIQMEMVKSRATDVDASAMHMMCTQGVHINYPSSCGKIICNIS